MDQSDYHGYEDDDRSENGDETSPVSEIWKRALWQLKRIFAKKYNKNPPQKLKRIWKNMDNIGNYTL